MVLEATKHKILVVADESDCRVFIGNILTGVGLRSIGACDTTEGLKLAESEKPAVIILDVMMANKEGIKMYHHLKRSRHLKKIPVIMLSAIDRNTFYLYEKFRSGPRETGIPEPEAFLEKPPEAEELIHLISQWVAPAEQKETHGALKKEVKSNELVRTPD